MDELATQYEVVFLPSTPEDVEMSKMIAAKMRNKQSVKIIVTNDVNKYESLIRSLRLLISTRMHPSIIAARNYIPFISIIYDHKQVGFLLQIGLKKFSLYISEVSYEKLKLKINEITQNYDKIQELLQHTIPELQSKLLREMINWTKNLTNSTIVNFYDASRRFV